MQILTIIFLFFLGAIFGSFFGVVLDRFNTGKGIGGRSMCLSCKRTLCAHELVPVVSYVCQGGKCRGCKTKISVEYFFLELLSGLLFVATAYVVFPLYGVVDSIHFFAIMAYYLTVFSIFLIVAFYDMRHMIVPDTMVYPAMVIAFLGMFLFPNVSLWHILAGPLLALPFALVWFFTEGKYMGLGDAKLALPIGWVLGLSSGAFAILLAFWIGAIFSLLSIWFSGKKLHLKKEVPFAPYLVMGALIAFAFSISIQDFMMWMY